MSSFVLSTRDRVEAFLFTVVRACIEFLVLITKKASGEGLGCGYYFLYPLHLFLAWHEKFNRQGHERLIYRVPAFDIA